MKSKSFVLISLLTIFTMLMPVRMVVADTTISEGQSVIYLPLVFNKKMNQLLPGMVFVPDGEFQMGCNPGFPDCDSLISPAQLHTVYLDAYYIDIYEVTNSRYATCVSAGVCTPPAEISSATRISYYDNPIYANYPIIFVNWSQANTFCQWEGYRLPTEAEWEKAAIGYQDPRLYPWGSDQSCSLANYSQASLFYSVPCVGDTTEVGSYPTGASPYGLMDMAGNVWEWVSDYFDINYYDYSPYNNPTGPETGSERTFRGGSWYGNQLDMVSSFRYGLDPNTISDDLGFRCAYSP